MPGFTLDLAHLPQGTSHVELEADSTQIGLTAEEWPGRVVGVVGIERDGDRIHVRGTIRAAAWLECVRCLKGFERTLSVPFDVFSERAGRSRQRIEEELERGNYMKFHDGRRLALGDDAREALLLELPMAPRCREDCAGLCPRCGAELDNGPCGCDLRVEHG